MKRAFPVLVTEANQAKTAPFLEALLPLPAIANDTIRLLHRMLLQDGHVPARVTATHIDARGTTERYKYQAANAASGAFRSWYSNSKRRALETLRQSSVKGTHLYRAITRIITFGYAVGPDRPLVNRNGGDLLDGLEVDHREALRLARHLVRRELSTTSLPRFRKHTWFNLDQKVIQLQEPTTASRYQYWLKAATINRRQPAMIPVYVPKRLRKRISTVKTVQARVTGDGQVQLKLVGDRAIQELEPDPDQHVAVLGIDTGAAVPVATSEGDLLGRRFWAYVQHVDALIQRCVKGHHASGILKPTDSPRYRQLVGRLRDYVTNEIRRYLKQLIHRYTPEEVVVEAHTFGNKPGLSRRMNRLLNRVGVGAFNTALADLAEEHGFTVTQVNPAYTSQECPSCHHVERANRDSRNFSCRQCGRTGHADVVGAVNIRGRRSATGLHRTLGSTVWLGGREHALRHVRKQCSSGRPTLRVESRPRAAGMAAHTSALMSHDVPATSS